MKSKRLALITSVALPFMASAPAMALPAFGGLDVGSSNPIAAAPPLILAQTPEELLLLEQQRQQQEQQQQQQEPEQQEEPPPPPPQQAEPPPPPPEPPAPPPEPPPPPPEPPAEAAPPAEPPPPPPEVQAPPPEPPAPPPEPEAAPPEPPPPPQIETPPAPEPTPPPPVLEQTPTEPPVLNPPIVEPPPVETPAPPVPRLETPPSADAPPPSADTPSTPPTLEAPPPAELPPPTGGSPPVDAAPPASEGGTAPVLPPPEQGAAPAAPDGAQTAAPPAEESATESQLEAQGDQEAVDNVRTLRAKLRDEQARGRDGDGQGSGEGRGPGEGRGDDGPRPGDGGQGPGDDGPGRDGDGPSRDGPGRDGDGRDGDRDRDGRWERERPPESDIVLDLGGRFIIRFGDQVTIRQDDAYESDRFLDRARDVDVEHFPGGYSRTTVTRGDGSQIITVRDRYGEIMTRTRIDTRGRQVILIDNREFYRDGRRPRFTRFEDELPPLRYDIPRERYIVETSHADRDMIYAALMAPPVEAVERPYALDEIRMSERLRSKMPRVDLNTLTFDFGSAAISPSQFGALTAVGQALEQALGQNPDLIFLVEGHTDAVGSDNDNLVLSDQRAEAIAVALSSNFNIPPENLVTQGYGEQYLKVPTDGPEVQNRRVTIRNITELAQGN